MVDISKSTNEIEVVGYPLSRRPCLVRIVRELARHRITFIWCLVYIFQTMKWLSQVFKYHRVFIIVLSCFHHLITVFSSSYHRVFINVSSYHCFITTVPSCNYIYNHDFQNETPLFLNCKSVLNSNTNLVKNEFHFN